MSEYVTKRISLPGGQVVDIVYFSEAVAAEAGATRRAPAAESGSSLALHICPECSSDLVYPVSWEERDDDAWSVERRCPECEWRGVGEFDQDEVEIFDDALNDGTEAVLMALRDTSRQNMEEDVERLIDALRDDLIQPMDF